MSGLVDQVKGGKQRSAPAEEQLDLQRMAVAHYANTDHDTAAGRLIQGQVDHTLMIGKRVHASKEELAEMEKMFVETDVLSDSTLFQLSTCPVCQRSVSHGEFGVDHIMYYLEGDEEKVPRKIRSLPRIWCTPCAKHRAKHQKKPYLKSREDTSFKDEWAAFVAEIRKEQGQTVDGDPATPPPAEPANEPTRKLWAWLAKTLVGKSPTKEGKMNFAVVGVEPLPGSDLDLENKSFSILLKVSYDATTKLVSGETVDAFGTSVVKLALAGPDADVDYAVHSSGSCKLKSIPDAEVLERCQLKTDLIGKVWVKKGVNKLLYSKLADLKPHALRLMASGSS